MDGDRTMNGQSGLPWAPPFPPGGPSPDEPQGAAAMLMVVQALQRLHAAFNDKFLHPANLP